LKSGSGVAEIKVKISMTLVFKGRLQLKKGEFLRVFAELRQSNYRLRHVSLSLTPSVCLSVRMEYLGSHCKNFD